MRSSWRGLVGTVVSAVLLATAGGAMLTPQAIAGKKGKEKHDLKVQKVEHPDYLISPDPLRLDYTIKNVGRKTVHDPEVKIRIYKVSGTLPSDRPAFTANGPAIGRIPSGESIDDFADITVPLGRWQSEVCVKFRKDKRKGNDCKRGPQFSVIPLAWRGATAWSSSLNSGSVTEQANAPNALFAFERRTEQGFEYSGSGQVTYSTSGTDIAGCTHSGSKAYDIPADSTLVLSEDLLTYSANGLRPPSHTYQVNKTCPPPQPSDPYTGPFLIPAWIQTGQKPKTAEATTLSGSNNLPGGFPGTWAWSLDAQ